MSALSLKNSIYTKQTPNMPHMHLFCLSTLQNCFVILKILLNPITKDTVFYLISQVIIYYHFTNMYSHYVNV